MVMGFRVKFKVESEGCLTNVNKILACQSSFFFKAGLVTIINSPFAA